MRWRGRPTRTDTKAIEAEPDWSRPTLRHSPGLDTLLARLNEEEPVRFLDLGPSIGCNIQFLAPFACHIRVVDLLGPGSPITAVVDDEERQVQRLAERTMPSDWGPFDVVLMWDLLDYLTDLQAKAVVERLRELSSDVASVFTMIGTTAEIPERPARYTIVDRSTVSVALQSPGVRTCPKWTPAMVERLLRGFYIERSIVLRHGVQEFVAIKK